MISIMFHLFFLTALERAHSLEHLIPVDEITVELRSVNAYETSLSTYGKPASTAHTSAIDHDCVKRDSVRNIKFLCKKRRELHHHWRTDSDDTVYFLTFYNFFHTDGNDAFLSVGAVIGHYYHLVRVFSDIVLHYDKVLGASGQDRHNLITCLLQCCKNW